MLTHAPTSLARFHRSIGLAVLLGLALSGTAVALDDREVTLRSADGFELAATHFPAPGEAERAVLLVHMRGRDRFTWKVLPYKLQRAGMAVLSIDLRGHGQSVLRYGDGDEPTLHVWSDLEDADWARMTADVAAGLDFLSGAAPGAELAVIGAGIGANLAIVQAAADERVAAVAMLSGTLDKSGVETTEPMREAITRTRVLLVASRADRNAYPDAQALFAATDGRAELVTYENVGNGTNMLFYEPGIESVLSRFLTAAQP